MPVPARAEIIAGVGEVLTARKAELAELVSRECGKVRIEAGGDVQEAVDMARFVAGQGRTRAGASVSRRARRKLAWTTRIPVGVVGMITPWNFPVAIPSWKCFPALLAGNGIVLKPSEHSPACAEAFVAACVDGGVPPSSSSSSTAHAEPAAALAVHPGVGAITSPDRCPPVARWRPRRWRRDPGSSASSSAARTRWSCLDDADLDLAVDGALFGAFGTPASGAPPPPG